MRGLGCIAVAVALVVLATGGGDAAGPSDLVIPGSDVAVTALAEVLPWDFAVQGSPMLSAEELAEVGEVTTGQRVVLRTTRPIRRSASGDLFLDIELTSLRFADRGECSRALDDVLAGSDPDTGLSYAWDILVASGSWLHHLHADCTLAEEHVVTVATVLVEAAARGAETPPMVVRCRCGGGCSATACGSGDSGAGPGWWAAPSPSTAVRGRSSASCPRACLSRSADWGCGCRWSSRRPTGRIGRPTTCRSSPGSPLA